MNVSHTVCLALLASSATAQATWTHLYPTTAPSWRYGQALAYDSLRSQVVLFGGSEAFTGNYTPRNDLWTWSGAQWQSVATSGAPSPRDSSRIAFDSSRGILVLFGGEILSNPLNDTWELAGSQWTQRVPLHQPTVRHQPGMTFDSARGRVVLFGGQPYAGNSFLNDTWEWDGTDWTLCSPSQSPLGRSYAGFAFDPAHNVSVLFGGSVMWNNSSAIANDTWTWDGSTWRVQMPANSPPPASAMEMVYDCARARIVAYGTPDLYAWEWDGQNWQVRIEASPGTSGPMAYDPVHREVVRYGSQYQAYGNFGDTWIYATSSPATFTAYGDGCAGSAGTPVLVNAPYSLPWLGDTFRTRATSLASATSTVVFATSVASTLPVNLAPYGMPGCYSLVDTSIIALDFVAAAANAAEWSIAVPNSTALNGAHVFQQAIALEAGANAAGAIVSNAGDIGVGIR